MDQLRHLAGDAALGIGILPHPPLERRFAHLPRKPDCAVDLQHRSVLRQRPHIPAHGLERNPEPGRQPGNRDSALISQYPHDFGMTFGQHGKDPVELHHF